MKKIEYLMDVTLHVDHCLSVIFLLSVLDLRLKSDYPFVMPFNTGAVPGTFTCLKWSLVSPDFKECYVRYIFCIHDNC